MPTCVRRRPSGRLAGRAALGPSMSPMAEGPPVAQETEAAAKSARRRLEAHSWPGNVRQLRSVIRRAVILAREGREVGPEELELGDGKAATTLLEELEQAEKRRVIEAL